MMLLAVFVPVGILLLVEYYSLMKCKCKRIPLQKKQKAKLQSQQSQLDRHPDYFVDESVLAERNLIEKLDDKERSKYAAVCEGIGKSIGKKMIIIRFDLSIAQ